MAADRLTYGFITLGCKVNQCESAYLAEQLQQRGLVPVRAGTVADVYVVNTCTVTSRTDFKSRNAVRRLLRLKDEHPDIRIYVTGCCAHLQGDVLESLGPLAAVVDNTRKDELPDIITGTVTTLGQATKTGERHRAFIKIEDGCSFFCAYCIVPHARGPVRSYNQDDILNRVIQLTGRGFKEYVLTGINLGLYGSDNNASLQELVTGLAAMDDVRLLRFSSWEPQLFDINVPLTAGPKLCPHFHIPLQSGDDAQLKAMGRHYSTADFARLIAKIKSNWPHAAIGLDVIAGLPGEDDTSFARTVSFLQSLPITYLHVFSYSKRPGTPAADMPSQVDSITKKERAGILAKLSDEKKVEYIKRLIADKVELRGVAERRKHGLGTALSDHYIRVYFADNVPEGALLHFTPLKPHEDGIWVEVKNKPE